MNGQELFTKISEMLEKFGIKEALKNPQVVETIYDVMSKHGMKVDKNLFNIVVMGFAVTPTDKLGSLIGMLTGAMGAAQGAAANRLRQFSADLQRLNSLNNLNKIKRRMLIHLRRFLQGLQVQRQLINLNKIHSLNNNQQAIQLLILLAAFSQRL